jgi:hypothetical protein
LNRFVQYMTQLTSSELQELQRAKIFLSHTSRFIQILSILGKPVEVVLHLLPRSIQNLIQKIFQTMLKRCLAVSIASLQKEPVKALSHKHHLSAVACTGAIGGAFGLPALFIELPVSTTIMLRSIASIAQSEGFDPRDPEVQIACLEVFFLSEEQIKNPSTEMSYWVIRAGMTKAVTETVSQWTTRGVLDHSSSVILKIAGMISSRTGILLSEQLLLKILPIIGAIGGAATNYIFLEHFQNIAHGHFIIKRLEKKHSPEIIQSQYLALRK